MLRTFIILVLVSCLSLLPVSQVGATCGKCGVPAPGEGVKKSSPRGGGGAGAAAAFGIMFGALMAAKAQEANKDADLDKLAEELAKAFERMDPTQKYHKK
ncbi:MAG TPA: hypothetical protein ACFYD1_03820 [Candidatus Hypogeohydataceae bacterium YC38]|nr:hypothetical protein [Candidatus Brocadiales bacterium]